MTKQTNILWVL